MSLLLHHESIGDPGAIPIVFLHGIFGSGSNWRTFARQLIALRPNHRAILVDLRMHGRSQDFSAPHTIENAAADVTELIGQLRATPGSPCVVFGHSFGGKVAALVRERVRPVQTWILDTSPNAHPEQINNAGQLAVRGLAVMEAMPATFVSREAFVEHLAGEGFSPVIAKWLATNVERRGEAYGFRLRAEAMRDLLTSYYQTDIWHGLGKMEYGVVEYVVAGKESAVSGEEIDRLRRLGPVTTSTIEDAGHWIHIDRPEALRALVVSRLLPNR